MNSYMELFDYIFPQIKGATKDQMGYHLDHYCVQEEQKSWLLIFELEQEEWVLKRDEEPLPVFISLLDVTESLHKDDIAFQNLKGELLQMASQEDGLQKTKKYDPKSR